MRRAGLLLLAGALAACTGGGGADLLLLPTLPTDLSPVSESVLVDAVGADLAGQLPDVRSAVVVDAVPGDDGTCGTAVQDRWVDAPVDSPAVGVPDVGYSYTRTAPEVVEGEEVPLTVVCDLSWAGELLVEDELRTTGTDQPVGNDYATRAGARLGRVDVGVPDGAVVALQVFDEWTLLVPVVEGLDLLRLHALDGGSAEEGYDVGEVRFFDADGTDITPASAAVPDIIHGVPRDRGSGVGGSSVEQRD